MNQNIISRFFNEPSMWFWALVMTAVMSVAVFHISEVYIGTGDLRMSVSDFISSASEGDSLFTRYIGVHLLPFGIKFHSTGDLIRSNINSDFTSGILILAVCLIGVIIVTKKSSNAISALGPFWVYSIISLILMVSSLNRQVGGGVRLDLLGLPCLTSLIVTSLITALVCRTIIRHAVNQGWISGIDTGSNESVQINPEIVNKVNQVAGQVTRVAGDVLEVGTTWTSGKLVGRNIRCCPFCGSDQFTHVKPHPYGSTCNSCGRIVGALEEKRGGSDGCPVCPSGLVNGAKFCHRCGTFLENHQMAPISNGSNQVHDNYPANQSRNDKYEQHDRNHESGNQVSAHN